MRGVAIAVIAAATLAGCSNKAREADTVRVVAAASRAEPIPAAPSPLPIPAPSPSPIREPQRQTVVFPDAGPGLAQPPVVPGAPAQPLPPELAGLASLDGDVVSTTTTDHFDDLQQGRMP